MQNRAAAVPEYPRWKRSTLGLRHHFNCTEPFFCRGERVKSGPGSWPGPDGGLLLLAQLLAQFLPFLGSQLSFFFACLGGRALGLQGMAQIGSALFTLGWPVLRPGGLDDRLRQGMPLKAKKGGQQAKSLHHIYLTRWRQTPFTFFRCHSRKLS